MSVGDRQTLSRRWEQRRHQLLLVAGHKERPHEWAFIVCLYSSREFELCL